MVQGRKMTMAPIKLFKHTSLERSLSKLSIYIGTTILNLWLFNYTPSRVINGLGTLSAAAEFISTIF